MPARNQIQISLSDTYAAKLARICERAGLQRSELIRRWIDQEEQRMTATATTTDSLYAAAEARVRENETLAGYRDLLLDYDWPNRDEHLAWVANADVAEIVDWAEAARRDEQSAEVAE